MPEANSELATTLAHRVANELLEGAVFSEYQELRDDLDLAYEVQALAMAEVAERAGTSLGGRKIGFNTAPLMELFGIDAPLTAWMRSDQIQFVDHADLSSASFRTFAYEPEMAVTLNRAFEPADTPYAMDEVRDAIATVHAAIELVDVREASVTELTAAEIVGRNILSAGALIAGPGVALDAVDQNGKVEVAEAGEIVVSAVVADGADPVESALTMVNEATMRGLAIPEGVAMICGAFNPPRPISDTTVRFSIASVGSVSLSID